jgi:YD repeat-containing protein
MHREVSLLYSRIRQLVRGLNLCGAHYGRFATILLGFSLAASVSASSVTYTYTYDELGRLKIATSENGTSTAVTTTYSLDAAGNRTSVRIAMITAPTQPNGLSATPVSETEIDLAWNASSNGTGGTLAGYYIYRDGARLPTTAPASPLPTFHDTALLPFSPHNYTVSAFDNTAPPVESLQSSPQIPARTLDTTKPNAPSLTGSAMSETLINLSWTGQGDSGSGLGNYQLSRTQVSNGVVTNFTIPSTAVSYSDSGLTAYTAYSYTLTSYDQATPTPNFAASNTVAKMTLDTTKPNPPTTVVGIAESQSEIDLLWTPSTGDIMPGSGLGTQQVYRDGTPVGAPLPSTARTYADTGLTAGSTHTYVVTVSDLATPIPNTIASAPSVPVTTPTNIPNTPPGTLSPNGIVTSAPWTETWQASAGPVAYYILNKTGGSGPQNFTINAPATSSSQTGTNGVTYEYQVQACNSSGQCSAFSTPVFVTRCNGGVCP